MIRVQHLTKKYAGREVVSDISFGVPQGEIVGFLGPNGAGKSTTLRMLTGYLAPTDGSITINGVDILKAPVQAKKSIGYMAESVPLYRELRVMEYLRYRARLKGVGRKQLKKRVETAMEMAGITDVRSRIIGHLSKGYRSRLGLAEALVADPPLLILDEPTAGLDPNQIRQVRALIRSMVGEKTVLLSTHILPEAESTCGHVLIIHRGVLVGEGIPGDLRASQKQAPLLRIQCRSERTKIESLLQRVVGVQEIKKITQMDENPELPLFSILLQTDPQPEVAETVFQAIADAGLRLRELRREQVSLEDVFAALTTEDIASQQEYIDQAQESLQTEDEGGEQ